MSSREAYRQVWEKIRGVLMNEWDPIGVSDIPEAADEYDSYIGVVYRLIVEGSPASKIAEYLRWVEVERMGLTDHRGAPLLAESVRNSVAESLSGLKAT